MFRNLLYTIRQYKAAWSFNLIGLCLAFFFFTLVHFHYHYEMHYDSDIPKTIYQMENLRDDGVWDVNFSRPMAENLLGGSSLVQEYGLYQQFALNDIAKLGFSAQPEGQTIICSIEQSTPQYFKLFDFDFVYGGLENLNNPLGLAIPLSISRMLFGDGDPIGKSLYLPEFKGLKADDQFPFPVNITPVVAAVYRDFPSNTRLTNSIYLTITPDTQIDNWRTCNFYCYLQLGSKADAEEFAVSINEQYAEMMNAHSVEKIRIRPVSELYFGEQVRNDAAPRGSKTLNHVLLFIALLIVFIALSNYINFSVALAPQRAKAVTMRKVLGSSDNAMRVSLVLESVAVCLCAYALSLLLLLALRNEISVFLNHDFSLAAGLGSVILSFAVALLGAVAAGLYPAFFTTSFPAAQALNGSFMLNRGAKFLRKALIGLQFFISIALVSLSLFIVLQNRYIASRSLGFEKENVLEIKLSMGTALSQGDYFRTKLMQDASIKDVGFCQIQFVSDGTRPLIGYSFEGHHSYISWTGVSPQLPELMGIELIEGRYFRQNEQSPVCIINETAAKELSQYSDHVLNSNIMDNGIPVEIIGIMKDVNYESLYKSVTPLAFWSTSDTSYRSMFPGSYAYAKVASSDISGTVRHIRKVADELNPGYPVDVHFMDESLDRLYSKSRTQGILVATLSLIAVILSLIGVSAMAIFEAKRLRKEIAIRKVWGAEVEEILALFTRPVVKIILISALISVPLSIYGINIWLRGFAYHIPVYWWVFVVAVVLVLAVTVVTIRYQNHKVACSNPRENL